MRVSIIAAVAENGVIGRAGKLPWHLSEDLKRFRRLTTGHTIVMGRKTWESIGKALPDRRTIVISRQKEYRAEGAEVVSSFDEALRLAESVGEVETFVVGGAEIYRTARPRVDRYYLTLVKASVDGDAIFVPEFDRPMDWVLLEWQEHGADSKNDYPHLFFVYQRCDPVKQ